MWVHPRVDDERDPGRANEVDQVFAMLA